MTTVIITIVAIGAAGILLFVGFHVGCKATAWAAKKHGFDLQKEMRKTKPVEPLDSKLIDGWCDDYQKQEKRCDKKQDELKIPIAGETFFVDGVEFMVYKHEIKYNASGTRIGFELQLYKVEK